MSARMVSPAGSCLLTVAVLLSGILLLPRTGWADPPDLTDSTRRLALPHDPDGGTLYGPLDEDAPPQVKSFIESTGAGWNVFWDRFLETPTLAYPHDPLVLHADPDAKPLYIGEHAILKDVRAFIDTHRDFLGVGPEGLAPLEVSPFDDGLHISARQIHQGLPVRGSAFRMLINGDRTIRSIDNLLARNLPEIETGTLSAADIEITATEEGLTDIIVITPQVAFPPEVETPVAASVVVGNAPTGQEVEVMYSLVTGQRIWGRTTTLYQEAPPCDDELVVEGLLRGYYPDPEEVCTTAQHVSLENPWPIIEARVTAAIPEPCPSRLTRWTGVDGFFSLTAIDVPEQVLYRLEIDFCHNDFLITRGYEPYMDLSLEVQNGPRVDLDLNQGYAEFPSFHLMASHHLRKVISVSQALVDDHGVAWERRSMRLPVELHRDDYLHEYSPFSGRIILGNDERVTADENGRARKMVPTIIYHEYGHEFIGRLSGETSSSAAHEGVADAFACYIARTSTLGYATEVEPNADSVARDLSSDTTSYPDAPRTTVSGALWELWWLTRNVPSILAPPNTKPDSPFAKGLLTRWLAAKLVRGPAGVGGNTIQSNPRLGHAFYLQADHESLGGDNLLRNGFRFDRELLVAFGRRNLFQFRFIRGDANADASLDLSDAVTILGYLFLGESETSCLDALDSDDSGKIDLSDAVVLLTHLFLGGPDLPLPFGRCDTDKTLDDGLGCWGGACGFISPGW